MADVSLPDLLSSAGQATGDFLRDLGNSIADSYCELYHNHPGFVVGSAYDPVTPFRRGLADSLCHGRRPGLPPPPTPQFSGGQCVAGYTVNLAGTYHYKPGGFPDDYVTAYIDCIGPIRAIYPDVGRNPGSDSDYWTLNVDASVYEGSDLVQHTFTRYMHPKETFDQVKWEILSIDYKGTGTDNCGDPPPDYLPTTPSVEELNITKSLPLPSGGPNVNIPFTLPRISADIDFNIGLKFSVPINLNLNFNLGGLTLNIGKGAGGGFTDDDRKKLNDTNKQATDAANTGVLALQSANAAKDAAIALRDPLDGVHRDTGDIKKAVQPPPPPNDPKVDKDDRKPDDRDRRNAGNLLWVKITLTTLPYKNKQQSGDGAPNVYYGGWFEWMADGFSMPREPIAFGESIFLAPKAANGYAFTLTNGAVGYATEYREKQVVES